MTDLESRLVAAEGGGGGGGLGGCRDRREVGVAMNEQPEESLR